MSNAAKSVSQFGKFADLLMMVAVLAVGVAGFFRLWSLYDPPKKEEPQSPIPLVSTTPVEEHVGGLTLATDGVVVPYRKIEIAAEVGGRIVEKADNCRSGHYVSAGTLLLRIDDRDYRIQLRQAEEDLVQAENALEELEVELANTRRLIEVSQQELEVQRRDFQRVENLRSNRAVAEAEFDQAQRSLLATESALLQLENQLRAKQASRVRLEAAKERAAVMLEKAQLDLDRTEIRMPVNGVVVEDLGEKGSYVRSGTIVLTVEDTTAVEVDCSLRSDQIAWLWPLLKEGVSQSEHDLPETAYRLPQVPATVTYEVAGHRYRWQGRLSRYESAGYNELTRMVSCRVLVEDPLEATPVDPAKAAQDSSFAPPALLRGMFVSVQIQVAPQVRLLNIPETALRPGDRVARVRDGKLKLVEVRSIDIRSGEAVILADPDVLQPGDHVAVSPTPFLENTPLTREGDGTEVQEQIVP